MVHQDEDIRRFDGMGSTGNWTRVALMVAQRLTHYDTATEKDNFLWK